MRALRERRVLTEDRPENSGFFSEGVEVVVEKLALRCSEWVAAVHFGVRVGLQMKEEVIVNANHRTRLPIVVDGQSLVKAGLRPPRGSEVRLTGF